MPWIQRGSSKHYQRSVRIDRRVITEYFSDGPAAHEAAAEDARRKAEREAARQEQLQINETYDLTDRLARLQDQVTQTSLLIAGFHQHDRGEWRKKRV